MAKVSPTVTDRNPMIGARSVEKRQSTPPGLEPKERGSALPRTAAYATAYVSDLSSA
jgi:hypothetical protein